MDKINLGKRIRIARKQRQFTIDKLSEKCGLTEQYLGNIERGKDSPSFKALLNIANELEVDINYLLGDDLKYNALSKHANKGDIYDNLLQQINTLSLKKQESVVKFINIIKEYKD